MKLLINTVNDVLTNLYSNHEHYNPGDSGLDLYCPETITVKPGELLKSTSKLNVRH